jgi:hypothetical protein
VVERSYVAKPNSFKYRSYARYGDASSAIDAVNKQKSVFKRAYLVDRDSSLNVILP